MTEDKQEAEQMPELRTLANGATYDMQKHRIVANPGGGTTAITKQNVSEYNRMRQEKTKRLLREAITAETADKLVMTGKPTAAAAVAAAGGILWRDIVLADPNEEGGPKAYPRDRLETWKAVGLQAGLLTDAKQASSSPMQDMTAFLDGFARTVNAVAAAAQQAGATQQAQADKVDIVDAD